MMPGAERGYRCHGRAEAPLPRESGVSGRKRRHKANRNGEEA